MNRPPKQQKVQETTVESENRDIIIHSDTRKLLVIQREGDFTYRCVDCCHEPLVCLQSWLLPCVLHIKNTRELNMKGSSSYHCLMCLLSPFLIGSIRSVGKAKTLYRKANAIPGLVSDDVTTGMLCPCCIIAQIRYELNTKKSEEKAANDLEIELGILVPNDQTIERV